MAFIYYYDLMGNVIIKGTEREEPDLSSIDNADFDLSAEIRDACSREEIEVLIQGRKKTDVLSACRHMVLADDETVERALDVGILQHNVGLIRWAANKIFWIKWTSKGMRSKARRALRSLE